MDALEEAYERGWKTPSDINEHAPKLRELASQVKRVTEFGMRPEVNTVAFLAAIPEELHSYGHVPDSIYKLIPNGTRFHPSDRDSLQETITETDLLFLDTVHTGDRIKAELERHHSKVTRYIVVHDTHTFGQRGEDGGPGLMVGIVHFLQTHPEWQIAYMTQANNGLAVLSRNQEDWPDTPFVMFSPGKGPGTEMKGILSSLGINPAPGCDCNAKAAQMDTWGVEGCRERRGTIVEGIKKNASKWGWTGFAAAAVKAVTTGLATRINPFDPYGSLVDEAIRRAEEKEQKEATRD